MLTEAKLAAPVEVFAGVVSLTAAADVFDGPELSFVEPVLSGSSARGFVNWDACAAATFALDPICPISVVDCAFACTESACSRSTEATVDGVNICDTSCACKLNVVGDTVALVVVLVVELVVLAPEVLLPLDVLVLDEPEPLVEVEDPVPEVVVLPDPLPDPLADDDPLEPDVEPEPDEEPEPEPELEPEPLCPIPRIPNTADMLPSWSSLASLTGLQVTQVYHVTAGRLS